MEPALDTILLNHSPVFASVVEFAPEYEKLYRLNLTASNTALTDAILEDLALFSKYISSAITTGGARYAIGGYNEHRTVYKGSKVFDATKKGDEPRRLHLGVDIWGEAGTTVMAPLDGLVHSFAFNDRKGDYGATIILQHELDGIEFYTLYGHLSLSSIASIPEGQLISKGTAFAAIGSPKENGYWPPHLHFQIIDHMGEWKGDYPGVCKFSEREKWLSHSPDPDLILQMNQYL